MENIVPQEIVHVEKRLFEAMDRVWKRRLVFQTSAVLDYTQKYAAQDIDYALETVKIKAAEKLVFDLLERGFITIQQNSRFDAPGIKITLEIKLIMPE